MDDSLRTIRLARWGHSSPQDGTCLMEAVSLISGENFSSAPACVDRSIILLGMFLNDRLEDCDRSELLLPFLYRLPGTKDENFTEIRKIMLDEFNKMFGLNIARDSYILSPRSTYKRTDRVIIRGIQLLDDMIKLTEIQEPSTIKEKEHIHS